MNGASGFPFPRNANLPICRHGRWRFAARWHRASLLSTGWLLAGAACAVLSGCLIKRNDYQVPALQIPATIAVRDNAAQPATVVTGADINAARWWRQFDSPELDALVQRALTNNPDLRIATLHVAQAQIRANQAHGARLPTVDAGAAAGPQHGSTPSATTSAATLTGSWRADLWGELAAAAQEADYQLWQAKFDADNTRRTVIANIVTAYVDYRSANDRIRTAALTEALLTEVLVTIEKRCAAGDATMQEVEQQRAVLFSERAQLPTLQLQRDTALAGIATLTGTLNGDVQLTDTPLDALRVPEPVTEVPSALLLRRADVRATEARLLAADADIDVMRARLLPSFTLTAQTGYSGLLEQLVGPKSFFWNLFGNVSTNLFDAGKLSGDIDQSRLLHEEMVTDYAKTLQQAVRETEMALKTVRAAGQRVQLQQLALESASRALDISKKMYLVGGTDFMTLQDTERTYQRFAEDNLQTRADYYHSYIGLYEALGVSDEAAPDGNAAIVWDNRPAAQPAWLAELAGVYQGDTIGPALQDLQARYPELMQDRQLYPRLLGTSSDVRYGHASWYRLRVGKFTTLDQAGQFCARLQQAQQRCQTVADQ